MANTNEKQEIRQAIADAGIHLVYLPPYCPELNPIEHSFHDIKVWIRRSFARVSEYVNFGSFLRHAIVEATSPAAAMGHFRKAGYCGAQEAVPIGYEEQEE